MSQHTGPASDEGNAPSSVPKHTVAGKTLTVIAGSVVALGALATFVVLPAVHGSTSSTASALNVQQESDATNAQPAGIQAPVQVLSSAAPAPRDPFSPLITSAAPAPSSVAPSTPATSSVILTPTASATPTTVVPTKVTIDLFSVSPASKSVEVTLNSALYEVKQGQIFGGNFMLLAITPTAATFDYGDQPFTLGVGQSQTFS